MTRSAWLGGLLAACVGLPALAQSQPYASDTSEVVRTPGQDPFADTFYAAPMFSFVFTDGSRNTDDAYGAKLALGRKFGSVIAVEGQAFYNRLTFARAKGTSAADLYGGGLSVLLSPIPSLRNLYAIGQVDYGNTDEAPGSVHSYNSVLYGGGLGYLYQVTQAGTSLRAELLYRVDSHDSGDAGHGSYQEPVFNIGLMFPLGGNTTPPPAATPAAVVPLTTDDDNDGVPNDHDQCPGSLPGVIVDAAGCEYDADRDGVVDRLDRCPDTPLRTAVTADGCPASPPAEVSHCRPPAVGERITLEGCGMGDTIVLQGVTFEFNQAKLTHNAQTILDGVGDALAARPDLRVEIGGHTDSKGSDDYNQKLSERRAQSVLQYLVGRGVDAGRMSARGYGEASPVADNETEDGRELNRRVELKIVQ